MGILDRHNAHGEDESHTKQDCGQGQPGGDTILGHLESFFSPIYLQLSENFMTALDCGREMPGITVSVTGWTEDVTASGSQ